MPLLNEFLAEVLDYLDSSEKLNSLKEQKEQLFPYSNAAVLEDLRKISSLSLLIKLLKKEPRNELEDLKVKVLAPHQTFLDQRRQQNPLDEPGLSHELESERMLLAKLSTREESPSLRKLRDLNKKFLSDRVSLIK